MKQNEQGEWIWKFDPLHRTTAPQPFYSFQAIEFLRRINCPVLIIEGKQSDQAARPDKEARLDALRDKRLVQVDNAGHMVHQDNPEMLAALLSDFLL
jgi:pimeloyl-ACP methyl ester carboxylesterase